jgi:hypothetical protein
MDDEQTAEAQVLIRELVVYTRISITKERIYNTIENGKPKWIAGF